MKAHAANHKRQASSSGCRERGFIYDAKEEQSVVPVAESVPEAEEEIKASEADAPDTYALADIRGSASNLEVNPEVELISFGADLENSIAEVKKANMS